MGKTVSPLVGYNTNVRHGGKVYHIQTEDSGIRHPHVVTHLFVDGGRIVASRKTSYAEHLDRDDLPEIVKRLMRQQHKAMFIALRQGRFDEDAGEPEEHAADTVVGEASPPEEPKAGPTTVDVETLERAADRLAGDAFADSSEGPAPPSPLFGEHLLGDKSLDEVILSYLAEDLDDQE